MDEDRCSQRNQLLTALPQAEYKRLLPHLEPLALKCKQTLYEANQLIEHVYFLQSGMASLLTQLGNGTAVEVATLGNEAMVGLPVFWGVPQVSGWTSCVQILPGQALRMSAESFRQQVTPASPLYMLLQRYTQVLFHQVTQLTACHRLHLIREQCCRWLLTTHDRSGSNQFQLTQDYLSQLLGVRRSSINEVGVSLQQSGLLRYRRGRIEILNRAGLEASSCECYFRIKQEYDRLIDGYSS